MTTPKRHHPRGSCPRCGGRANLRLHGTEIGSHRVVGMAGHGGYCSGIGQPPTPGSVR